MSSYIAQNRIFCTSFGKLENALFTEILELAPEKKEYCPVTEDVSIRKYSLVPDETAEQEKLFSLVRMIAEESWRVKGFVALDGTMYLIDCTNGSFFATPYDDTVAEESGIVNVLSSGNLKTEQAIKNAMKKYPDIIKEVR